MYTREVRVPVAEHNEGHVKEAEVNGKSHSKIQGVRGEL